MSNNFFIKKIQYSDLKPIISRAKKDRVSFSDTPRTLWVGSYAGHNLIVCGGVFQLTNGVYRIKAMWVDRSYRGRGYGSAVYTYLIDAIQKCCGSCVEAYAYNPDFYTGKGYTIVSIRANGSSLVRKVL